MDERAFNCTTYKLHSNTRSILGSNKNEKSFYANSEAFYLGVNGHHACLMTDTGINVNQYLYIRGDTYTTTAIEQGCIKRLLIIIICIIQHGI